MNSIGNHFTIFNCSPIDVYIYVYFQWIFMQIYCANNAVSRNKNDLCQDTLARKLTPNRLTIFEYMFETRDRNPRVWMTDRCHISHLPLQTAQTFQFKTTHFFSIYLLWWLFSFSSSHFVISLSAELLVMICKIYTIFFLYSRYGVKNHQQFCRLEWWERQHRPVWAKKKKEI